MIVHSDLHVHTTISACCSDETQTPEDLIPFLPKLGIGKIAFTDHLWQNPEVEPSGWYSKQNGEAHLLQKERCAALAAASGAKILFGCEAEMKAPGVFGITPDFREKMDIVLLASDHFHMKEFVQQPEDTTPAGVAKHMLAFFRSAAASGLADILAHPLWCYSFEDIYPEIMAAVSDAELEDALAIAAQNNVAFELNGTILRKAVQSGPAWQEALLRIACTAKDAGCKFTLGSDSHDRGRFVVYENLRKFTNQAGITEEDLSPLCSV